MEKLSELIKKTPINIDRNETRHSRTSASFSLPIESEKSDDINFTISGEYEIECERGGDIFVDDEYNIYVDVDYKETYVIQDGCEELPILDYIAPDISLEEAFELLINKHINTI